MLSDFTAVANAIAATTRKLEKERLLAAYLVGLDDASLERAAVFFSGSPFPRREQRVTGVGGAAIGEAVAEATGLTVEEVWAPWSKYADPGDTVAEAFAVDAARDITLSELGEYFDRLAATQGAIAKRAVLVELFGKVDAQGARYIVKILTGELRIGLVEGLVESSIARAFERKLDAVRRANMFTGDIGAAALLARSDALESAQMTLFHPFALMLAQPEEDPAEIVAALGAGALADDKYDGIRAQIHADGSQVRIYSRTLDEVTHRFPEVEAAARELGHAVILDGELVAFNDRILPFAVIQTRLGRRKVSEKLLADAPVAFFAFDLLYLDGQALFELPLRERLAKLRNVVKGGVIRPSDQSEVRDAAHVDELFDAARARANEGLVVKDPSSIYTPGRRGKSWLKYKKALATLDCVVTYAQWGNGKRRAVLSDLTFAVRRDDELVNIGKAYSGLTDAEIAEMTKLFHEIGIEWHGPVLRVEPRVVLEIAFDRIQESSRHKSGYALRFPRIARIRDDKTVEQISTIDEVRRIYEGQRERERGTMNDER
ncbi:MAG TPA: ATP-dependent DNA ligase [Thermoanaerobaculia bacterium]|jgi:DNA ligase-1|nr:ATP-dependent DNA ligase [Thermoanaerobaculia bacterium]